MKKPRLALTAGDPNGIGPEIALRCALRRDVRAAAEVVVYGSEETLSDTAALLRLNIRRVAIADTGRYIPKLEFGKVSAAAGAESMAAIDAALRDLRAGRVSAMVTSPICKEAVVKSGRRHFVGHTDYLAEKAGVQGYCLALYHEGRAAAFVTLHESVQSALRHVTRPAIVRTGKLLHDFLRKVMGRRPRLAVSGLNPHAGESGMFGKEEIRFIIPAVADLRRSGVNAQGPFPPDIVFPALFSGRFDGVVSLLHDHGHVAFKTALFRFQERGGLTSGVNITLGLPFIRTSADHGTAFDIAGKGVAHPGSLRDAALLAAALARR